MQEGNVGATIGIIILVILVALGGIYFFYKEDQRFHTPPVQETVNA